MGKLYCGESNELGERARAENKANVGGGRRLKGVVIFSVFVPGGLNTISSADRI